MYLNQLNLTEKNAFMSLSIHAANADGVVDDSETLLFQNFCKEMEIPYLDPKNCADLDQVIKVFAASAPRIKKIVMFELLGLLYTDGEFSQPEQVFAHKVAEGIGVSDSVMKQLSEMVERYYGLLMEISVIID